MIVNKRQLADIFGVAEETLTQWQKQGMPILLQRKGQQGNQYETKAVIEWINARRASDEPPTDYDTERTRKVKLEADILALEKAKIEGKLIPADKAETAWVKLTSAFRAKLLSIPNKYAPILAAQTGFIEIEQTLNDAIYRALNELSDSDLAERITDQFDEAGSDPSASTEINSK